MAPWHNAWRVGYLESCFDQSKKRLSEIVEIDLIRQIFPCLRLMSLAIHERLPKISPKWHGHEHRCFLLHRLLKSHTMTHKQINQTDHFKGRPRSRYSCSTQFFKIHSSIRHSIDPNNNAHNMLNELFIWRTFTGAIEYIHCKQIFRRWIRPKATHRTTIISPNAKSRAKQYATHTHTHIVDARSVHSLRTAFTVTGHHR